MKPAGYAFLLLLLAALYIYFLGTPWLAAMTGFSPRAISLTAGIVIVVLVLAAITIGKRAASRDS